MAKLTERDFKKEVTAKAFSKIYLIYGDEKYLVRHYTSFLVNKALGKNPTEFDLIRLGSDTPLENIFAASRQISMFSEIKCVLVSDYDIDALSEGDYHLLEQFTSEIPDGTILIFSMPTLIKDVKKSGKLKKLAQTAAKAGTVLELEKKEDIALEQQLVTWAEKRNCTLSRINASKIIAMCSTDMTTLHNEMEKLCAYADGREITEKMIYLLVVKSSEARIFALSDCVVRNDFNAAYQQLHRLLEQNEKPEIILSVLSSAFIDMYRMKMASESGVTAAQVAADFKYGKREFLLRNAANNAKKYSAATLRNILNIILDTDIKLKSTRASSRILLETLLSELMLAMKEGSQ